MSDKYYAKIIIGMELTANSVEEAEMKTDSAINLNVLKNLGLNVTRQSTHIFKMGPGEASED